MPPRRMHGENPLDSQILLRFWQLDRPAEVRSLGVHITSMINALLSIRLTYGVCSCSS